MSETILVFVHIRTELEINREFDLQILQKEDTVSTKHLAWVHEEDYVSKNWRSIIHDFI
jgi:hypothetical protein